MSIYLIWELVGPFRPELLSGLIAGLIALTRYYFSPSVRLRWGRTNVSYHKLPHQDGVTDIYAEKHYLQNSGRKPAIGVEFVFSRKPTGVNVWQARDYSAKQIPEGHFVLNIPQIAPRELVIIDSIYVNADVADIISVKNADCLGKEVQFVVNRNYGLIFNLVGAVVLSAGAVFLISIVIRLLFKV